MKRKQSPKQLANLKKIKKGQVLNPLGGRAHKNREIKALTIEDLTEVGKMILKQDVAALNAVIKEPGASVLKVWTASIAVTAIRKGDHSAWSALLDRFIGRVPVMQNAQDLKVPEGGIKVVLTMPSNGREASREAPKEGKKENDT